MGTRIGCLLMFVAGLLIVQVPRSALGQGAPPVGSLRVSKPADGARLFAGQTRFANGGPPCIACHSAGGVGGAVGPDLTTVVTRYGGARNLDPVLATIPFPTMRPVFAAHPLTPRERADLIAFLSATAQAPAHRVGGRSAVLGVLIAAVLTLVARLVWRERLLGVRRALVRGSAR